MSRNLPHAAIALIALLAAPAVAAPSAEIPAKLNAVKAKLEAVQAQLDEAIEAAEEEAPPPTSIEELQEQVMVLEEDISELLSLQEKQGRELAHDRLDWSVAYRATLNNVRLKNDQANVNEFYGNIWNHRVRLGFHATNGPLRFSGRLAVFKNFGESDESTVGMDSNSTRYARDTSLRLERAFLDLFVNDWFAFTLGRVASPEGPPAELKENSDRSGTWGIQMVEAEFETILATFNIKPINSSLRVFYSPFFSHAKINPMDDNSLFQGSGIKPSHIWGFLFESNLPKMGDNLFQLGFVHIPFFRPQIFPIMMPDGAQVMPSSLPDDIGSYLMINTLLEVKDVYDFDFFAAGSVTLFNPTDPIMYEVGAPEPLKMGLASFDQDRHHALMGYAGVRYKLPMGSLMPQFGPTLAPRLGAEYNYGSENHVTWGSPSETLFNKLGVRGHAIEGYAIIPMCPDLFMRLGALHIMRDYKGGFIGPSTKVDEQATNFYFLINARWF
ncbi:DUF3373 domain-containing protein [Myxococcota bacterium]|nr:DUF3373 domain-containing protein [Myxococcota bacterium]